MLIKALAGARARRADGRLSGGISPRLAESMREEMGRLARSRTRDAEEAMDQDAAIRRMEAAGTCS